MATAARLQPLRFVPPVGWGGEATIHPGGWQDAQALKPVVIDCETCDATEEETRAYRAWAWKPNHTWKPETVEEKRAEDLEKWLHGKEEENGERISKRALVPTAPVISVTMKTPGMFACLHAMPLRKMPVWLEKIAKALGATITGFSGEKEMLEGLAERLGKCGPEVLFAGHNVRDFDLPKLRGAMMRHEVALPAAFSVQNYPPVFDTMREFRKFCAGADEYVGLAAACHYAGIDLAVKGRGKGEITGKDIPGLYEQKKYDKILMYALFDVVDEEALYLRMSSVR